MLNCAVHIVIFTANSNIDCINLQEYFRAILEPRATLKPNQCTSNEKVITISNEKIQGPINKLKETYLRKHLEQKPRLEITMSESVQYVVTTVACDNDK